MHHNPPDTGWTPLLADHTEQEYRYECTSPSKPNAGWMFKTWHASSGDVHVSVSYFGGLLTLFSDFSQSLSDTCEIRVFQLVCERRDICYYAFQKVVFGDLFAGLENEFNITGLESIGFIISITIALSDTKLSFKHPNDTLKFNEILSPANI